MHGIEVCKWCKYFHVHQCGIERTREKKRNSPIARWLMHRMGLRWVTLKTYLSQDHMAFEGWNECSFPSPSPSRCLFKFIYFERSQSEAALEKKQPQSKTKLVFYSNTSMVVGVPSSVTIVEEGDMNVCELPICSSTIPIESTPASLYCTMSPMESLPIIPSDLSLEKCKQSTINIDDLPFDLLAGEEPLDHGVDLTDGTIYLTNYRLFIFSTKTACSFINCPLRLIDSVEVKDNLYLCIQCKDIRSFRLAFFITEKCCYWLRKLTEAIAIPTNLDDLFAIKFASAIPEQDNTMRDRFNDELSRLQLDSYPWRLTEINRNHKLCTSYPEYCVVPLAITDDDIAEVAKFRSYRRFPTIVWR